MSKSITIDMPIVFRVADDRVYIDNLGYMNDWIILTNHEYDIETKSKVYNSRTDKTKFISSVQSFSDYFQLEGEWKANYKGQFPMQFFNASQIFSSSGSFVKMIKTLDIMVRRCIPKEKYWESCYMKDGQLIYSIALIFKNQLKIGDIVLSKPIKGVIVS